MRKTEDKVACQAHSVDLEFLEDIKEDLDNELNIDSLAKIFKVLGDPSRLKIIYVLSKTELCVCDIATLLDMTQSSISHHLRVLRNLNLVKFRREGRMVVYSLDDDHVFTLLQEGLEHTKH